MSKKLDSINWLKLVNVTILPLITFTILLSQISMVFAKAATLDQGFANSTTNQIKSFDSNTGAQLADTGAVIANQIKNFKLIKNINGVLFFWDSTTNAVVEVKGKTLESTTLQTVNIDPKYTVMDVTQRGYNALYALQDKITGEPFIALSDALIDGYSTTGSYGGGYGGGYGGINCYLHKISPGFNSPEWKIIKALETPTGYSLYWQNINNGQITAWNIGAGHTIVSTKNIVNLGNSWKLVDVLNSNMVLQNTITGEPIVYTLDTALNIVSTSNPWPGFNSPEWKVIQMSSIFRTTVNPNYGYGGGYQTGTQTNSIIWQNNNNGVVSIWFLNSNNSIQSTKDYPAVGSNWKLVSYGDFAFSVGSSNRNKLTWQHNVIGEVSIWNTNANLDGTGSYNPLSSVFSSEWELKKIIPATATKNRVLVYRNRLTGKLQFRSLTANGLLVWANYFISRDVPLNSNWRFVDAYYDNHILETILQNTLTGEPLVLNSLSTETRPSPTFNSPEWKLVKVTDMNKDGSKDFIWQNSNNGAVAIWYLDSTGLQTLAHKGYQPVGTDWKLIDVANINNDGNVDFIWQLNSTSGVSMWLLDGSNNVISYVDPSPGFNAPSWKIVKVEDMNEDGRGDFVWQNTNGTVVIWYLNNNGIPYSTNTVLQTGLGADYVLVK